MNNLLNKAYQVIFRREPESKENWQIAEEIIKNFDGRKFDVWETLEILNECVNGVSYPTAEKTHEVVEVAEALFEETLPDDLRRKYATGEELHMAALERIIREEKRLHREADGEFKTHQPRENKLR